jgi:hypothetical protein
VEHWKTKQITLIAQEIGQAEHRAEVPCESVSWQPPGDIPPARGNRAEPGYLLVKGIEAARLADITWTPTHVRFSAEGYFEMREFAVTGWEADPDARTLKLPIP